MHRACSILCTSNIIAFLATLATTYTPIAVKKVTDLGPQLTPDVNDVSRDGGHSTLVNGNVVWLYDDTECFDKNGAQLSFVSNTASYSTQPSSNVTTVTDFGVVGVGHEKDGSPKNAILADTSVGTGGWVPFQADELEFNDQMKPRERVAIWPGTAPTSISPDQSFLFAPLVYVDMHPQDPAKEYQGRGMTLIAITAPPSGPAATRQGDLVIPGTEIGFGGFTSVLGRKTTEGSLDEDDKSRDVYLFGVTNSGLQVARTDVSDLSQFSKFQFWEPAEMKFTNTAPKKGLIDNNKIYMPGTFSSGSVFYSPYFNTFIMVYFNKKVDSTFYIRYLDLSAPLKKDKVWKEGGKNGKGIEAEDAEALVKYSWSAQQTLYASPPGKGGFNYAGSPHPEFFNKQYFAKSLYPENTPDTDRFNAWYGSNLVSEDDAKGQDGKYLLVSWTSQKKAGMKDGVWEIQLALVEFDDIPKDPNAKGNPKSTSSSSSSDSTSQTKPDADALQNESYHDRIKEILHKMKTGSASTLRTRKGLIFWCVLPWMVVLLAVHSVA